MKTIFLLVLMCWVTSVDHLSANAAEPSSEGIVDALLPIRPEKAGPLGATRSLRGLTIETPELMGPPSIDISIGFAYDSAELDADGLITVKRLGIALSDPRLSSFRFLIAGHTDATGATEYNQILSERRAAAIRDVLVLLFEVPADRLQIAGYGEQRLVDPARPDDAINRRVQIVNIGAVQ